MLQTWIHRIKPGKEQRLRDWLGELNSRADEVCESFAQSGVRAEQAFVVTGATESLLVYVSDADNQETAARQFAASTLAIDIEHRAAMDECIQETLTEPPVYDNVC